MIKLSVIVPVYNREAYLTNCIESIINLNLSDMEIIIVDDGSDSDGTPEIADEFSYKYPFISVLHVERMGSFSARIKGVSHSRGKYIAFVDSDDYVLDGIYSNGIEFLDDNEDVDIYIFGFSEVYDDGFVKAAFPNTKENQFRKEDAIIEMLSDEKFGHSLCDKLYRKSLFNIDVNCIGLCMADDLLTNWFLFNNANSVYVKLNHKYCYRNNSSSMTKDYMKKGNYTSSVLLKLIKMNEKERINTILIREFIEYAVFEIRAMVFDSIFREDDNYLDETTKKLCSLYNDQNEYFITKYPGFVEKRLFDKDVAKRYYGDSFKRIIGLLNKKMDYDKVYVYGDGLIANYLISIMNYYHIICDAIIISKITSHSNSYRGIRYIEYKKDVLNSKKDIVYLAMSRENKKIIREKLLFDGCVSELVDVPWQ